MRVMKPTGRSRREARAEQVCCRGEGKTRAGRCSNRCTPARPPSRPSRHLGCSGSKEREEGAVNGGAAVRGSRKGMRKERVGAWPHYRRRFLPRLAWLSKSCSLECRESLLRARSPWGVPRLSEEAGLRLRELLSRV